MINLKKLVNYLNELLTPHVVDDYCPNGLQIQGRQQINRLVTGVSACQALLDAAVTAGADAILVHHGYFWENEAAPLTGIKYQRIHTLLQHNISLLAYHLPLDLHPVYGNNVQLAKQLNIKVEGQIDTKAGLPLLFRGHLPQPQSAIDFANCIEQALQRQPLHIAGANSSTSINTVVWCTGAGQNFLSEIVDQSYDAYVTGEVSEHTVHLARESELHFFAAGHHATERYGVKAVGEHLEQKFGIQHQFIDIANPV